MDGSRAIRFAFAACAVWLALHELHAVVAPGAGPGALFSRFAHDVLLLAAAALCLARALSRRHERAAWLLIGSGILAWSLGEAYYTAVRWADADPPIPSPADAGYLLFGVLALAGLVSLMRTRMRRLPKALWADTLTAALAVSAVSAAIVFEEVLDNVSGKPFSVAVALAYPLRDLVLLGLAVAALAATARRGDRSWALLSGGIATFWLADSLYLLETAEGVYRSGRWFDAGWWGGLLLIARAAWQPAVLYRPPAGDEGLRPVAVPLGFGLVGLGLLVYACFWHVNGLAVMLAAASQVAVMLRLTFTFRENVGMLRASRAEAMTDALTGLGNRRALTRDLAEAIAKADRARPVVLALFDLDGFKQYNDTFGHPAGDALLERLGSNLGAFVRERGRAYRMGGDEFGVLLAPGAAAGDVLVRGAAHALSERGEGFSIGCSFGAVTLPAEAADAADALRMADQRMYEHKHAGRRSASRQSKDVLLRALAERSPDLGGHVSTVAGLAEATARRLGLPLDEVERVRHAAELHDVGKVAIPDAILSKPGPLTADEWAFVHRHPVVGERIVAAAPALIRVARLVRWSHERWDGRGYPDRVAGADIPLGSRIVAVADAFDAMTRPRPYREPRAPEEALGELERCAGTQFDPEVVQAFAREWAAREILLSPVAPKRAP